jgi:streptogramin lyase
MRSERKLLKLLLFAAALIAIITPSAASAAPPFKEPSASLLVTGLQGALGSTVGPDGALYVTEGLAGRISRVDPETGEITTFASGLPPRIARLGGAMDVAFIGHTAYVLVTLVGSDIGGKRHGRHLSSGRSGHVHRHRGHRRVRLAESAADSVRRPDWRSVRARTLRARVPGHRWASQSGAARHT